MRKSSEIPVFVKMKKIPPYALNQIQMIKGDQLHVSNYTGTGMTIAILDAGFPNVHVMTSFKRLRDAGHILDDYDFIA